jgi:hypothetical protein
MTLVGNVDGELTSSHDRPLRSSPGTLDHATFSFDFTPRTPTLQAAAARRELRFAGNRLAVIRRLPHRANGIRPSIARTVFLLGRIP